MRIVHLNRSLFWKRAPVIVGVPEALDDIGQRTRNQKIFLNESQRLACNCGVIRVKHSGNGLSGHAIHDRADKVARTELAKIEKLRRVSPPEAKRVDVRTAVANYWTIIRNAEQVRTNAGHGAKHSVLEAE